MAVEPNDARKRVADWWSDEAPGQSGIQWVEVPRVARNVNLRATGDPDVDWVAHSAKYLEAVPRPRSALSVGCGFGFLERRLRRQDVCEVIEGVDLAGGAVDAARRQAAAEGLDGLTYRVADLNTLELPADAYDIVYAHAALHHVFALEHLLDQIRRSLKPSGVLVLYEYVGPSQMQFPRPHLELADKLLRAIPPNYRTHRREGGLKDQAPRLSLETMNASDPSEAVRSQEIIPLVASRFRVEHLRYIGGTLLLLVFNDIAGNLPDGDPVMDPIIDAIIAVDNVLIDTGVLPSYHAYAVCRKTRNLLPAQTQDLELPTGRKFRVQPRGA